MGEWISVVREMPILFQRVDIFVNTGEAAGRITDCLYDSRGFCTVTMGVVEVYPDQECITHWLTQPPPELLWHCKHCGENERPGCPKCTREDGLLVTDELVRD